MFEESLKFEFTFSDKELEAEGLIIESDFEKARVLLGAITKVLGFTKNEKPSLAANFFEIGGDSLSVVDIAPKLVMSLGLQNSHYAQHSLVW